MVLLKVVGDDGMCEGVRRRRRRGRERLVEIPIYHMRRNNGKNGLRGWDSSHVHLTLSRWILRQ